MNVFRRFRLVCVVSAIALGGGISHALAAAGWEPMDTGIEGWGVMDLHVWNGELIASGDFTAAGGQPAHNMAAWDGVQWSSLDDGWDQVWGMATWNGLLAVAGKRPGKTNGEIATWDGTTWTTVTPSDHWYLAEFHGKLYQGDWYYGGGGPGDDPSTTVWEFDGMQWKYSTYWIYPQGTEPDISALEALDDTLYVRIGAYGWTYSFDGTSWAAHGTSVVRSGGGFAKSQGVLYSGGSYFGIPSVRCWNGSSWKSIFYEPNCGPVNAVTTFDNKLIVAADLGPICPIPGSSLSSWNGTSWEAVTGFMDHPIWSLCEYNGKLIAAGTFTVVDSVSMSRVAQLSDLIVPVTITRFAARQLDPGVELTWAISSDERLAGFDIYRGGADAADVRVNLSLLGPSDRRFVDHTATPGSRYSYYLVAKGESGNFRSQRVEIQLPPLEVTLRQNTPNPFNPKTIIRFVVAEAGHVAIDVFDTNGKLVRMLIDAAYTPGEWSTTWNGTDDAGSRVASGVYFYRMRAGKVEKTRKMILLK